MSEAKIDTKKEDDEVSPRYRNLAKLAKEESERKKAIKEVVSRAGEVVPRPNNKFKYREVIRLSNGNVYRKIIDKKRYEELTGTKGKKS